MTLASSSAPFPLCDLVEGGCRESRPRDDLAVNHDYAVFAERTHRELLVPGQPELSHHDHVEGESERIRHLARHRNTATGQPQHDGIAPAQVQQALRQLATRVDPVHERYSHSILNRLSPIGSRSDYLDVGDVGAGRTGASPIDQRIDRRPRALGLDLDRAVIQVPHETGHPRPLGLPAGGEAETHRLNAAVHDDVTSNTVHRANVTNRDRSSGGDAIAQQAT